MAWLKVSRPSKAGAADAAAGFAAGFPGFLGEGFAGAFVATGLFAAAFVGLAAFVFAADFVDLARRRTGFFFAAFFAGFSGTMATSHLAI
jgi:hypothetical protein